MVLEGSLGIDRFFFFFFRRPYGRGDVWNDTTFWLSIGANFGVGPEKDTLEFLGWVPLPPNRSYPGSNRITFGGSGTHL